jgi:SAM-dependent methyltransferase
MMTRAEFAAKGLGFSKEAGVQDGLHRYFLQQNDRLYETCQRFGLFDQELGDMLEIGAFYGYTPFFLQPRASSQMVLEGDDPAVYPLKSLYEKRGIKIQFLDLFEIFGSTHSATHALPLSSNSFDTILCWETMEHFNFNPVKFVRELHRVLKPGGRAYITVPNKASFQNLFGLISGRSDRHFVDAYFEFEDYISNGKKFFYGFHWHEYSCPELRRMFEQVGFLTRSCTSFVAFHVHPNMSPVRRLVRGMNKIVARGLYRYGTNVGLVAEKRS